MTLKGEHMHRTIATISLFMASATLAVHATAQSAPAAESTHGYKWKVQAIDEDFDRYYPDLAQYKARTGVALLGCGVEPDGHLSDCKVYVEEPRGFGFGAAAVALSRKLQLEPGTFERSLPVPNRIAIPITFDFNDGVRQHTSFFYGAPAAYLTGGPLKSTPTPDAGMSCYTGPSSGRCAFHSLTWANSPEMMASMLSVLKVGKTQGMDVAICSVSADRSLIGCKVTSQEAKALLDAYLPTYKAPLKADDGVAIGNGLIAIEMDWKALSAAANAMRLDGTGALPSR